MDFFGIPRGSIRSAAFDKLAALGSDLGKSDHFAKLISETSVSNDSNSGKDQLSDIEISIREYEVLLSLCKNTKLLSASAEPLGNFGKLTNADVLFSKLKQYLLELPTQKFAHSITSRRGHPPPWFEAASSISAALADLLVVPGFFDHVVQTLFDFTGKLFQTNNQLELCNYLTILGFLDGLTKRAFILAKSEQSFKIFLTLDACIDNFEFLSEVEEYSNTIYSQTDNEYGAFMDSELVSDLSPVLFIERLSNLMCAIISSILGNKDLPLLEYVLQKSSNVEDSTESNKANGAVSESDISDISNDHMAIIKKLTSIAVSKMGFLDRGESYIVYSTLNRLKIGYSAKGLNLQVIGCGMFTDNIDLSIAYRLFKSCLSIYDVMLDTRLGPSVMQFGSLLVFKDENIGSSLTRAFTSLVSNPHLNYDYCVKVSHCVGLAGKVLSQDAVVTTIYALTNLIFSDEDGVQVRSSIRRNTGLSRVDSFSTKDLANMSLSRRSSRPGSIISSHQGKRPGKFVNEKQNNGKGYDLNNKDHIKVCKNAVAAISNIVEACEDEVVSTLAVTLLAQKTNKLSSSIGPILLRGLVACAPYLPEREFVILVELFDRLTIDAFDQKNNHLLGDLTDARSQLGKKLKTSNNLYQVYLHSLLHAIISKGDVEELEHHRSHSEISSVGEVIGTYLQPLALLLPDPNTDDQPLKLEDTETINLFRNIWFNMVVHGYSINSKSAKAYSAELMRIAYNSPPLASELSWDRTETSLELNTVLRRGSSNHNVKDHKHILGDVFEVHRTMSYPKMMFLAASIFVESLRVKTGNCYRTLEYFTDPSMRNSGVEKYLGHIAFKVMKDYIYLINCGAHKLFSALNSAELLSQILIYSCHRIEELQDAALQCCDLLIHKVPSSLCHRRSLFALFDLLSMLCDSVIDSEVNQYLPTTTYTASRSGIQLRLSDSLKWRSSTFERLREKATQWLKLVLVRLPVDVKSLIQSYVSVQDKIASSRIQYGDSFAMEMGGSVSTSDRELSSISRISTNNLTTLPSLVVQLGWRSNMVSDLMDKVSLHSRSDVEAAFNKLREKMDKLRARIINKKQHVSAQEVTDVLGDCAALTIMTESNSAEMIRYLVGIPFLIFEPAIMNSAIDIWFTVMKDHPQLSTLLLSEIAKKWEVSIDTKQGIFSREYDIKDPEFTLMEYAPSNDKVLKLAELARKKFEPHLQIIRLFSSSFTATLNQSDHILKMFTRFVEYGITRLPEASSHPLARFTWFELIRFGFDVLNYHSKLGSRCVRRLTKHLLDAALSWFSHRAKYPFGSNQIRLKAENGLLTEVAQLFSRIETFHRNDLESQKTILMFFLDDEITKINVWLNPTAHKDPKGALISNQISGQHITRAYEINAMLAVNLALRYKIKNLDEILQNLIKKDPLAAISYPDAVQYLIGIDAGKNNPSHHLLFWQTLSPVDCITLFLPPFGSNPFVLQFSMRSLEQHDVNLTFFYVPQIVQSLRFDAKGYVERFIVETAKVSQLFAHQIIWNMLANSYKDLDSTDPDSLKPSLDRIQEEMLQSVSEEDLEFYHKEFGFFNEVTGISGKLMPYVKKTKAEKKVKIDEEMAKIEVKPGVYLPSNPDGVVVDISRKSGRPLQSHAKTPFMATFKIKKTVEEATEDGEIKSYEIEKWQSAIFKVGDDVRQDVLALQLISVFRTIWANAGLDLYVYPNRVTATAPGCGVIDVLPNSVSRDMLGREAVNGLYEYFINKFGPENSIEFEQARNNLIRSLAAYSIISFLLQFKDRHNGNIMYDDQGHILHIDFGFCFDIVPGGVKFEVAPFKLTHEMILILGGRHDTQAFQWFEELCVKGYLACRPYMETIVRCVTPMLESGLPCFKDTTIKKLRSRFVPGKSEREASIYFRGLIKKSMESFYTKGYDEFQRLTNGIPY